MIATADADVDGPLFLAVHQSDPLAAPLLDELAVEYGARYGGTAGPEYDDLRAYPAEEFDPPHGALILAVCDGVPVAGGAFRRYDSTTAELKRIWTASTHRQRGYGRRVVAELERIARQRGYRRVYLTTGWRQPEAVALYVSAGYTPLYDLSLPDEHVGLHPFEKHLIPAARIPTRSPRIMTTTTDTSAETFESAWREWHSERERYFGDPLGWVSLTGLYWLSDTFERVADLPGRWRADGEAVYVEGIDGTERLEPAEGAPGLLVQDGDRRIEVIRRTGSVALRVHDPKSPHLQTYRGIPAYAPSERWRIAGTFIPYAEPTTVTTGAVVEGLEHHHTAVGVVDFLLDGVAQRLVAFGGSKPGLQVLFTDATSGVTTYPAARSLSIAAPDDDGTVTVDFNRASNLPCSFTDYATCPVAPAENRLTVAVEAGEKTPR